MIYLFGYGSLIWRPGFQYETRQPAVLNGWQRRFWQRSRDHRGTPESPGRVVTIIRSPNETCGGVLYGISPEIAEPIFEALDHREKGGYEQLITTVHLQDGTPVSNAIVYHGSLDNPEYIGPEPIEKTARIIRNSHGPSGSNLDYLQKLAHALTELNETDPHINELIKHIQS